MGYQQGLPPLAELGQVPLLAAVMAEADMVGPETGAVSPKAGASSLHGKKVQHLLEQKQRELGKLPCQVQGAIVLL